MVLLAAQNFSSKLENPNNHTHHHDHHHDHHRSHQFSSSLQAFQSIASNSISQLSQSEILSLSWIHKFLGLLPSINNAFAKFLVDIDCPMSSWDSESVQLFLGYSSNLLDLFNSISSSLSHLGQARMSVSHGLSLLENSPSSAIKHLKSIPPSSFNLSFGGDTNAEDREAKDYNFSGKQMVVHEAVNELKRIGFWVCGIFLSGLCSDWKPYLEVRKIAGAFDDSSSVFTLDSRISELMLTVKMPVLKEIEEINGSVAKLLAASDAEKLDSSMELPKQLHVLENLMDDVSKTVEDLFGNVMTQRNALIDCYRITTQPQKSVA